VRVWRQHAGREGGRAPLAARAPPSRSRHVSHSASGPPHRAPEAGAPARARHLGLLCALRSPSARRPRSERRGGGCSRVGAGREGESGARRGVWGGMGGGGRSAPSVCTPRALPPRPRDAAPRPPAAAVTPPRSSPCTGPNGWRASLRRGGGRRLARARARASPAGPPRRRPPPPPPPPPPNHNPRPRPPPPAPRGGPHPGAGGGAPGWRAPARALARRAPAAPPPPTPLPLRFQTCAADSGCTLHAVSTARAARVSVAPGAPAAGGSGTRARHWVHAHAGPWKPSPSPGTRSSVAVVHVAPSSAVTSTRCTPRPPPE